MDHQLPRVYASADYVPQTGTCFGTLAEILELSEERPGEWFLDFQGGKTAYQEIYAQVDDARKNFVVVCEQNGPSLGPVYEEWWIYTVNVEDQLEAGEYESVSGGWESKHMIRNGADAFAIAENIVRDEVWLCPTPNNPNILNIDCLIRHVSNLQKEESADDETQS